MIAREDYMGPMTKAAQQMFARAEREVQRQAAKSAPVARPAWRPDMKLERRVAPPSASTPSREAEAPVTQPDATAVEKTLADLALSAAILRHWEDAGLVAFERRGRRRIFDASALEAVCVVAMLRRAGFTIKEIGWLSQTVPPSVETMRRALEDRLDGAKLDRWSRARRPGATACERGYHVAQT